MNFGNGQTWKFEFNKGSEEQKNTRAHTWIGCGSMNDPMVGIYV